MNLIAENEINLYKKSSKGRYVVFGNCQATFVADFLDTSSKFIEKFERIQIPGVHEMNELEYQRLKNELQSVSLFIYQPVDRGYLKSKELLEILPDQCVKISIPSLFFNSYNPEVTYIRESDSIIQYHDRIQLKYIENYHDFFNNKFLSPDFFPLDFSQKCVKASIFELRKREGEQKIDIQMSDYIENNYRNERLFHVLNHPTQRLLCKMSQEIINYLMLNDNVSERIDNFFLDYWQFPIYLSHYKNLEINFPDPPVYRWNGELMSPEKFFDKQVNFYAKQNQVTLDAQIFNFVEPKLKSWDLAAEFEYSIE